MSRVLGFLELSYLEDEVVYLEMLGGCVSISREIKIRIWIMKLWIKWKWPHGGQDAGSGAKMILTC